MKSVFLGGSRRVSRLNAAIRSHLDEVMKRGLYVFVGDAQGADKAMQTHLALAKYPHVMVFAVESHLRNNIGDWPVEFVKAHARARGRSLYELKDRVMADRAEAGLMLWDGESKGTLQNIRNLLAHGKPIALYYSPHRRFVNVRSIDDFVRLFPSQLASKRVVVDDEHQGELLKSSQDASKPTKPHPR